jgi:hypothetical protein
MITEPFELNGKIIKDAFMRNDNEVLVIQMEDGTEYIINAIYEFDGERNPVQISQS